MAATKFIAALRLLPVAKSPAALMTSNAAPRFAPVYFAVSSAAPLNKVQHVFHILAEGCTYLSQSSCLFLSLAVSRSVPLSLLRERKQVLVRLLSPF